MSRRYSLLGSLSNNSGGDGKLVNTITINNLRSIDIEIHADYACKFPPTSIVDVYFTSGHRITCSPSKYDGTTIVGLPFDLPLTIREYYPQEDENYIYEVVIEQ